jgi:hypothetical protein
VRRVESPTVIDTSTQVFSFQWNGRVIVREIEKGLSKIDKDPHTALQHTTECFGGFQDVSVCLCSLGPDVSMV